MVELALHLDPGADTPLYEQLYGALAGQIRTGRLAEGTRLPGKRSLAASLGLAVNTVDTAYQMLVAEGYLESRERSGFRVLAWDGPLPAAPAPLPEPPAPPPAAWRFDLSTSGVDTGLFPFRTWGRIQKELLYSSPQLLDHGPRQGDEELRRQAADYLRAYRGVQCGLDQVVIGAGIEYLMGLLARLLGGAAAVENPGYRRTVKILENNGVECIPVDIDKGGLPPRALEASGARVACITPSHQFPTGVTMPAPRRAQLLKWAMAAPDRWIIEDDYDSEFRFDIRPLPSLQGMAGEDGPVIYLTTFSKSLAPSIRMAAMVLPRPLLGRWQAMYGSYSSTVSRFEQETLGRFIQDGHFTRHLARLRSQYKQRMETLAEALEAAFPGRVELQGRHTGLHLLLTLKDGPGETAMVDRARAAGVRLEGLRGYYLARPEHCPENTVVVGYAALPPGDIPALAEALRTAWQKT